ncbi:hypothetical protein Gotur_023989, partial [Gossypium turneri]
MASNTLSLIAILSLTISILLSLYPQPAFSFRMEDFDGEEEYVLDHPVIIPNLRSRSRFLKTSPTKDKIRKGADCDPHPSLNICKVIGTTAENVATGASSGNVAAVEFVLMLLTTSTTVASVAISARLEFGVIMDFVVML